MKASVLKKLNVLIEEANAFKDKNKFQKAIAKLQEAINFVNEKVKEPEDKETEINNIKNVINQTYSVQINDIVQQAIRLVSQKEFDQARELFKKSMQITVNIDDPEFKAAEVEEIEKLIEETKLKELINEGNNCRESKNFDDALELFNRALIIAEEIYEGIPKIEEQDKIKNEIDQTCLAQIKLIVENGNKLKETGNVDEAIDEFEKALNLTDVFYNSDQKSKEITNTKNLINQIYSNKIKPAVEKAKELVDQHNINSAFLEAKKALSIANEMYESDLKNLEISLIAEVVNPIYIEKIKPIVESGKQITQEVKFEESTTKINKAVNIFKEALDMANSMIPDIKKDQEVKRVSDLINDACLAGINLIKENSVSNIMQKNYDDAISQLYSALSIAKIMTYPEEENIEIENLKNLVNKVYSAQVKEVLTQGDKLVNEDKYDEAIKVYNEALDITNKMYLTEEMEKEVGEIKGLIYQTEIKQLVGKGGLAETQQLKEKEIEKLKKRLDYANSIEDEKRRIEEMSKIKKLIDEVHSDEIRLLIEQGNQLAKQSKYEDAFKFFERALKVNELMEEPDLQNKNLIRERYKTELVNKAKQNLAKNPDIAIESCNRATELDENYVDAYYHLGLAYNIKRSYDAAIQNLNKAVRLNSNHALSWNNLGLAYEAKQSYDDALKSLKKAVEVDSNYAQAWYNMGNVYRLMNDLDNAIDSYKKATQIDSELAKAWLYMGYAYFDKKDYNMAIQHLERGITVDPNLGIELSSFIGDFKTLLDKIKTILTEKFINR
ncbi:MAG: tetratricopeptide repeat protein [Promethearchaeota archaeon]